MCVCVAVTLVLLTEAAGCSVLQAAAVLTVVHIYIHLLQVDRSSLYV
jgi:hypothetical protein